MEQIDRITLNPLVMGGQPCIRGMCATMGTILGLLSAGVSAGEILRAYPYLEAEDITACLRYGAWLAQSSEVTPMAARKSLLTDVSTGHLTQLSS